MKEKTNKAVCEKCGATFIWSIRGDAWPGGKDKENINCPYCGYNYSSVMTSGYVVVQKMENNE